MMLENLRVTWLQSAVGQVGRAGGEPRASAASTASTSAECRAGALRGHGVSLHFTLSLKPRNAYGVLSLGGGEDWRLEARYREPRSCSLNGDLDTSQVNL